MNRLELGVIDMERLGKKLPDPVRIAYEQMLLNNRLLWMNILAQNPMPAGFFGTTFTGNNVLTDKYTELFINRQTNPIAITVYGQFEAPGRQIKLSLSNNSSDEQIIDYLGDTALAPSYNKKISNTIILRPKQIVYIGYAVDPVVFPMTVATKFPIRIFDPGEFMVDTAWQGR